MSIRADVITRRTYNRPLNEEGTVFETWQETVQRVISHQRWLWERALTHKQNPDTNLHDINMYENTELWVKLNDTQEEELAELGNLLLNKKLAVAGRTLWLGNTDIGKTIEASQFNCAALDVQTVYDMVDVFWLLLNGAGVGFRPVGGTLTGFSSQIKNLEIIRSKGSPTKGRENNIEEWDSETKTWTIRVGDSAIAWAKFIGKLLAGKHRADKLVLDFSEIRKAGLRLRNYGWISQGDNGLAKASASIFEILNKKADSLLTAIDILDIVNLLGTVLSTRRSAQIAIYNYEDPEWENFIAAKNNIFHNGKSHRSQSNNSILFKKRPSLAVLRELFEQINTGGSGEPGIINGETMTKRAPWATLTNPCQPSYVPLLTPTGIKKLGEVNIGDTIWSEDGWVTVLNKWSTGIKEVFRYRTTGGYVDCTENHRVVSKGVKEEAQSAKTIDTLQGQYTTNSVILDTQTIVDGLAFGDGYWHEAANCAKIEMGAKDTDYETSEISSHLTNKYDTGSRNTSIFKIKTTLTKEEFNLSLNKVIPDRFIYTSQAIRASFLRGLYTANGSIVASAKRITFKTISPILRDQVMLLLSSLGIRSYYTTNKPTNVKFSNGEYLCKESYDVNITTDRAKFKNLIGFIQKYKTEKLEACCNTSGRPKTSFDIFEIESLGEQEVFDITVSGPSHTYWCNGMNVSNCGEILLPPSGGFCCLTSINLSAFKGSILELLRAAKLIARANYRQTVVDFRDGILQEKWHLNNDHLHLCGVSLMGIAEVPEMSYYDYTRLERTITAAAYSMAKELDKSYPKNVSTIKPEGTQSKCYDTTEGLHTPLGKYIFNNVAFSIHDPLVEKLKQANYNVFNHPYDSSAVLVTMPISYENVKFSIVDGKEVNIESAITQLERYKMLMQSYCHQNVSCTISYDKSETEEIVNWLYNNWDNYVAVSFLFRNDPTKTAKDLGYPYLPQEVVTKEVFDEYVLRLKEVNIDSANSTEELIDEGCANGVCPIR